MDALFLKILNMSITASFVILAVLVIRLVLIKVPRVFSFVLWGIVLFHLLCPFSFESAIGLLPTNQKIVSSAQSVSMNAPTFALPIIEIDEGRAEYNAESGVTIEVATAIPLESILAIFWVIGMMGMSLFTMVQLVKLKKKLIGATPLERNIYIADHIDSPFVMGLVRPRIYLPSNTSETDRTFIILHEQTHIARLDHSTRMLAFLALTLHWFNPLAWLAFTLSGKDMEMSCDESVMKKINADGRMVYSEILLKFATEKKLMIATPIAFGEGDTKSRVKNIMKYKKPVIWVSGISIVFVAVVAVGLMSSSHLRSFTKEVEPITATITEIDRENHTMKVAPLDGESLLHEGITLDIKGTTFTKDRKENSIADFSVGYLVDVYVNMTHMENDTVFPFGIDMKSGTSTGYALEGVITVLDTGNVELFVEDKSTTYALGFPVGSDYVFPSELKTGDRVCVIYDGNTLATAIPIISVLDIEILESENIVSYKMTDDGMTHFRLPDELYDELIFEILASSVFIPTHLNPTDITENYFFISNSIQNAIGELIIYFDEDRNLMVFRVDENALTPISIEMYKKIEQVSFPNAVEHTTAEADLPILSSEMVASKVVSGVATPFVLPVELMEQLIFDALIQSALFDNININDLDSYYHLKGEVFGEEKEIFIYLDENKKSMLQIGESGHDARVISGELYEQVEAMFAIGQGQENIMSAAKNPVADESDDAYEVHFEEYFANEFYVNYPEITNIIDYLKIDVHTIEKLLDSKNELAFRFKNTSTDEVLYAYIHQLELNGFEVEVYDATNSSTYLISQKNIAMEIMTTIDMNEGITPDDEGDLEQFTENDVFCKIAIVL